LRDVEISRGVAALDDANSPGAAMSSNNVNAADRTLRSLGNGLQTMTHHSSGAYGLAATPLRGQQWLSFTMLR
jgi:hypothetical protein